MHRRSRPCGADPVLSQGRASARNEKRRGSAEEEALRDADRLGGGQGTTWPGWRVPAGRPLNQSAGTIM